MRNLLDVWRTPTSYRDWSQFPTVMDRLLEDLAKGRALPKEFAFSPSCEVTEDKAHFYFKLDLPGLSKDQVKIEIHENELTVSGERKEEKKEDGKRSHISETTYGSFLRSFSLPSNIDAERVEAKFEHGVLTIGVAKTEATKARQVNIK